MKKKTKTKVNVRLLRRVQKAILKHANQFGMAEWSSNTDSIGNLAGGCGTAACLAGWTLVIAKGWRKLTPLRRIVDPSVAARKKLNLSFDEEGKLFYTFHWPNQFQFGYNNAHTAKQAAKVAVERIDHFIKTGE